MKEKLFASSALPISAEGSGFALLEQLVD